MPHTIRVRSQKPYSYNSRSVEAELSGSPCPFVHEEAGEAAIRGPAVTRCATRQHEKKLPLLELGVNEPRSALTSVRSAGVLDGSGDSALQRRSFQQGRRLPIRNQGTHQTQTLTEAQVRQSTSEGPSVRAARAIDSVSLMKTGARAQGVSHSQSRAFADSYETTSPIPQHQTSAPIPRRSDGEGCERAPPAPGSSHAGGRSTSPSAVLLLLEFLQKCIRNSSDCSLKRTGSGPALKCARR